MNSYALLGFVFIGFALLYVLLKKELQGSQKTTEDNQGPFLMLQQQLQELNRSVDTKLGEASRLMQSQFSESQRIIRDITKELVQVSEGQKQVVSVTDQLKSLQDILKNPKQRGVLGEYYLEAVLQNVLPPGTYRMQYAFPDGSIVDAAVIVGQKIIPIDSKFSLDNYNRMLESAQVSDRQRYEKAFVGDLKIRIDETSKYIKPENGTMEFAFMFIPSEAVYYDLLINKVGAVQDDTNNLITYAWKRGVVIVSPTSFLAYLQTVLQGLKALQFEESTKEIIKRVGELGKHLGVYETFMNKLGDNLGTTVNAYNAAHKELGKIDKDVLRISGVSAGIEPLTLDRPSDDSEQSELKAESKTLI